MSTDTKWIAGTCLALLTAMLTLAGLMLAQFSSVNARFDDLRSDMHEFRSEMRSELGEFRSEMRSEMREFRSEMRSEMREFRSEIRARLDALEARLDAVEVALAKLDQRLLTIERVVLPSPSGDQGR